MKGTRTRTVVACACCGETGPHAARGLITRCYARIQRAGDLDAFPLLRMIDLHMPHRVECCYRYPDGTPCDQKRQPRTPGGPYRSRWCVMHESRYRRGMPMHWPPGFGRTRAGRRAVAALRDQKGPAG